MNRHKKIILLVLLLCLVSFAPAFAQSAEAAEYNSWNEAIANELVSGTDTIIIDSVEYVYQGDAGNSGLVIEAATINSIWKAGEGYAAWNSSAKALTLHNAAISVSGELNAIKIDCSSNVSIVLEGENSLSAVNGYAVYKSGTGELAINGMKILAANGGIYSEDTVLINAEIEKIQSTQHGIYAVNGIEIAKEAHIGKIHSTGTNYELAGLAALNSDITIAGDIDSITAPNGIVNRPAADGRGGDITITGDIGLITISNEISGGRAIFSNKVTISGEVNIVNARENRGDGIHAYSLYITDTGVLSVEMAIYYSEVLGSSELGMDGGTAILVCDEMIVDGKILKASGGFHGISMGGDTDLGYIVINGEVGEVFGGWGGINANTLIINGTVDSVKSEKSSETDADGTAICAKKFEITENGRVNSASGIRGIHGGDIIINGSIGSLEGTSYRNEDGACGIYANNLTFNGTVESITGAQGAVWVKNGIGFGKGYMVVSPDDWKVTQLYKWPEGQMRYTITDSDDNVITTVSIGMETPCTLSGTITGHKNVEYNKVEAWLEDAEGNKITVTVVPGVEDTQTGKTEYSYSVDAPKGHYNLVVEATSGDAVVTRSSFIDLEDDMTKNINLPSGQVKSEVNKKDNEAPSVVVGGLDDVVPDITEENPEGIDKIEVEFTVDVPADNAPEVDKIKNHAPKHEKHKLEFFDFTLEKTTHYKDNGKEHKKDKISKTNLLQIMIPFDYYGKSDIRIYRYHEDKVDELTTIPNGDGEKIEICDGYMIIYAQKFSVYAIGYTEANGNPTPTPSTGSGGGFSGKYNYAVNASANGAEIALSDDYATEGETVTITVTPDMGKKVNEVIVTDEDGKVLAVTKVGANQYIFTMPKGKVNVSVTTEDVNYDNRVVLQINNKNIVVNNKTITNDVSPVIVGDRTLVPVRIVTELLGGTADWNENTRTVTLIIDDKVLKLAIDEEIPGFGTSATIINSRTYVPIRYVMEMLGANVEWIAATQQIIIAR